MTKAIGAAMSAKLNNPDFREEEQSSRIMPRKNAKGLLAQIWHDVGTPFVGTMRGSGKSVSAERFDRFLSADGVRARFIEHGVGPETIVILASPLLGLRPYLSTLESLRAAYRTIAIELPGCGRSDRLPTPWKDEKYADWLARAFEALGLKSVVLIGHSNSGAMAMWFAAKYPALVSRLVLVDSVGALSDRSIIGIMASRVRAAVRRPRIATVAAIAAFRNLMRHPRTFVAQLGRGSRVNLLPIAASVRVPTLLAWGGKDRTMTLRSMHRLRSVLPQASIVVNEKGDHDWIAARPSEFSETLRFFLGAEARIASVRFKRA